MKTNSAKEILGIVGDLPSTITIDGEKWKVIARRIAGHCTYVEKDSKGNPAVGIKTTEYLEAQEFVAKIEAYLKQFEKVDVIFAHDVLTGFSEVIGKNGEGKSAKIKNFQRQYVNGKWKDLNPVDLENELGEQEVTSSAKGKSKARDALKKYSLWVWLLIVAAGGFLLASAVMLWRIIVNAVR